MTRAEKAITAQAEAQGWTVREAALLALSEKCQRGEIDQLAYERERRVLAS